MDNVMESVTSYSSKDILEDVADTADIIDDVADIAEVMGALQSNYYDNGYYYDNYTHNSSYPTHHGPYDEIIDDITSNARKVAREAEIIIEDAYNNAVAKLLLT